MIKAVFFDFGGTLFDYAPSNYQLLAALARKYGVDITDNDPRLSQAYQKQEERCLEIFQKVSPDMTNWTMKLITEDIWLELDQILLDHIGIAEASALPDLIQAFNARLFRFQFYPEVKPTLTHLKAAGIRLGVLSNLNNRDRMRERYAMLQEYGIGDIWDAVVLSGEVGVIKPHPRIFENAFEKINSKGDRILPEEILMVGDTYIFDVLGAENVRWQAVLLDTNMGKNFGCHTIPDIPAVIPLLRKIYGNEL